jgi:hypothetical protein
MNVYPGDCLVPETLQVWEALGSKHTTCLACAAVVAQATGTTGSDGIPSSARIKDQRASAIAVVQPICFPVW